MQRLGVQHCNVKSVNCSYGIVSPTRFSPIRLPVRERTYYEIETLLSSFFGSLRVDYALQTPDQARVDYAPCDLTAKCDIEGGLGTYRAGPLFDTLKLKSCSSRKLSSGNPTSARPIGLRCSRHPRQRFELLSLTLVLSTKCDSVQKCIC